MMSFFSNSHYFKTITVLPHLSGHHGTVHILRCPDMSGYVNNYIHDDQMLLHIHEL